jgi:hypothetical protein
MASADGDDRLVEIALALDDQLEALGREVAAAIRQDIEFYSYTSVVSGDELLGNCTDHLRFISLGLRAGQPFDVSPAGSMGHRRAAAGVPLPVLMSAYRVGIHRMWRAIVELYEGRPEIGRAALLRATQRMWEAQDAYTDAMSAAYREQTVARLLADEVERVALTEHLLSGRVTDERTLWEIADLLRVPGHGPYLVVAARCPVIGKQALPGIANKLRSVDIYSAWRLSPDQHIGIVQLRSATTRPTLLELLQRLSHDRVGVSAPFEDLAGTARALRYARIALNSRSEGSNVTQFDDSVLGIAAVTEPDVTTALADRVLAGLNRLPSDDRRMLADTFNSWVDHGGSVTEAAADLVCHPNTVRHRLHRIEELTGRSASQPRELAELCLAFEIDVQLPHVD